MPRRSSWRRGRFTVASAPATTALPTDAQAHDVPRGVIVLVGLAALTVTSFGMYGIRGILAPVLLTLVLTICADPVRTHLQKRGVPQGVATVSVVVVMLALLAGFVLIGIIAVGQFAAMLPQFSDQFEEVGSNIGAWLSSLGLGAEQAEAVVSGVDPRNVVTLVSGALGGVFSISGFLVIVVTMMLQTSADAVFLPTIMRQLNAKKPLLVAALGLYASNVRRYMVVTALLGILQGVLNAFALWILNVPAALLWGLLAFLCSFIPNVGYWLAILPPVVFGFLVGGWPTAVMIVIIYAVINAVVQSIIQPRVVGQAVSLSQTLTLFSVLFWGFVIGPIGAVLAIPLTLLGKALLVDAGPEARLWHPAFGPTAETRGLKKADDAELRQRRKSSSPATRDDQLMKTGEGGEGSAEQSGRKH